MKCSLCGYDYTCSVNCLAWQHSRKETKVKQLVKVEEVEAEGLIGLMGQVVTLFCGVYIYTGKLVGVNDSFVKLDSGTAKIVYETGEFTTKTWKDAQTLPNSWYVQTA